ncbi:MAG: response regulator [Zetaproteobacteria bacterium]|nr:response regulator [Zetaproteobacteria bacterium]
MNQTKKHLWSSFFHLIRGNTLNRRLLFNVIIVSTCISAVITVFTIYRAYKEEVENLSEHIRTSQKKNLAHIAASIWKFDHNSLNLQMEGFTNLKEVVRVEIYSDKNTILASTTKEMFLNSGYTEKREAPIILTRPSTERRVGTLVLYITHTFIYKSIFMIFINIFIANVLKTMFISMIMLSIFKREVTDNLQNITRNVERIIAGKNINITSHDSKKFTDEIQEMVQSIDKMYKDFRSNSIQSNQKIAEIRNHIKSRDMFWAQLNHDIRTPLNALISEASWIMESSTDLAMIESAQKMNTSAELISEIADKMLLVAVEQDERDFYQHKSFDLRELIDQVNNVADPLCRHKDVEYLKKIRIPLKTNPIVRSDLKNIKRVLLNILSNAFKYTHKGQIIFYCDCIEHPDEKNLHVNFCISDTGVGIPPDRLNHIFDIFYSSDVYDPSDSNSGFGFGLYMSRKIIESLEGKIDIKSKEGIGTTVTLSMILEKGELESSENKIVKNKLDFSGKSILVVDDTAENRLVLKRIVKRLNPNLIDEATDGLESVTEYEKKRHQIIFMDLQMPKMDGISAIKKIRAYEKQEKIQQSQIIVCTAFARERDREIALRSGGDYFIAKPVNSKKLQHTISKMHTHNPQFFS